MFLLSESGSPPTPLQFVERGVESGEHKCGRMDRKAVTGLLAGSFVLKAILPKNRSQPREEAEGTFGCGNFLPACIEPIHPTYKVEIGLPSQQHVRPASIRHNV
jgi:hypothetical protein